MPEGHGAALMIDVGGTASGEPVAVTSQLKEIYHLTSSISAPSCNDYSRQLMPWFWEVTTWSTFRTPMRLHLVPTGGDTTRQHAAVNKGGQHTAWHSRTEIKHEAVKALTKGGPAVSCRK